MLGIPSIDHPFPMLAAFIWHVQTPGFYTRLAEKNTKNPGRVVSRLYFGLG